MWSYYAMCRPQLLTIGVSLQLCRVVSWLNKDWKYYCICLLNRTAQSRCLAAWFGEERAATWYGGTRNKPCLQLCTYCERSGRLDSCWKKSLRRKTFRSSSVILTGARVQHSRRKRTFVDTSAGCCWRSFACHQMILVCDCVMFNSLYN